MLCLCHCCWQKKMWIEHESMSWRGTRPKQVHVVCFTHNNQRCVHTHISLLLLDFDPNLGMMAGIAPLNPLMPGLGMVPAPVSQEVPLVKEIIHCKSCTLFPPNPSKSYNHNNPARSTSKTSHKRVATQWTLFSDNSKAYKTHKVQLAFPSHSPKHIFIFQLLIINRTLEPVP